MRIGHGYDVHAFGPGDHVVLGGVRIPCDRGLVAHSDGDVVVHALCDALLGGAGLGDIGRHFPDTDQSFKDIDSRRLLRRVMDTLRGRALRVGNVDITVIAQTPRLAAFVSQMRANVASDLDLPSGCVNVKATTAEGLGSLGRGEGIAAHVVALLMEGNEFNQVQEPE